MLGITDILDFNITTTIEVGYLKCISLGKSNKPILLQLHHNFILSEPFEI